MKKLRFLSIVTLAVALFWPVATSCAKGLPTDNDPCAPLPAAAKAIIKEHFAGKEVLLVKQETEWVRRQYDVVFSDGSKVEFDSNGEWTEIDCIQSGVPTALVPKPILDFVKKHYPNYIITQIDRDRRGYDVDLSNGLEIEFNKKFQVIDIDH